MNVTKTSFFLLFLLILPVSGFANKIDTIYFQRGDRITAEVKSLENIKLRLSTDDAGMTYTGDPKRMPLNQIVMLSPIEEKIMDRVSGTISSGFSYTRASDIMQFILNGCLILIKTIADDQA